MRNENETCCEVKMKFRVRISQMNGSGENEEK
jgi:hypothetical protein